MSEHGTGTGTGTKLEMVILRSVLVIPSRRGTKFWELGSRCEAVIAVLQGLMSSEVELVPGGVTGECDRFRTGRGLSVKSP